MDVRSALSEVKSVGRLVVLHEDRYSYTSAILEGRTTAEMRFPWGLRYELIERLLDANLSFLDISTGAFATLAAFACGAKSVDLVGFSFVSKGHSYNQNGRYRNHVRSDACLYGLLGQRGCRITSADTSIATILNPILL